MARSHPAVQPRHVHDSLILGVVTAGVRRIRTPLGETRIGPGEAFALPPGLAHACEPVDELADVYDCDTTANGPTTSIPQGGGSSPGGHAGNASNIANGRTRRDTCAYFAFSIQAASLPPLALAALPVRIADGALARTLSRLAEAVLQECGSLERQSLLAEALERLAACGQSVGHDARHDARQGVGQDASQGVGPKSVEGAGQAQPQDGAKGALMQAARRAKVLLESEDGAQCSLPELAQACGVDLYALHRAFTRAEGLPPHAYQTHLRLRRAKALLRAGASPTEAALEAGFCDQSHLNRHFARLVGLTPAQYAKAHAGRG